MSIVYKYLCSLLSIAMICSNAYAQNCITDYADLNKTNYEKISQKNQRAYEKSLDYKFNYQSYEKNLGIIRNKLHTKLLNNFGEVPIIYKKDKKAIIELIKSLNLQTINQDMREATRKIINRNLDIANIIEELKIHPESKDAIKALNKITEQYLDYQWQKTALLDRLIGLKFEEDIIRNAIKQTKKNKDIFPLTIKLPTTEPENLAIQFKNYRAKNTNEIAGIIQYIDHLNGNLDNINNFYKEGGYAFKETKNVSDFKTTIKRPFFEEESQEQEAAVNQAINNSTVLAKLQKQLQEAKDKLQKAIQDNNLNVEIPEIATSGYTALPVEILNRGELSTLLYANNRKQAEIMGGFLDRVIKKSGSIFDLERAQAEGYRKLKIINRLLQTEKALTDTRTLLQQILSITNIQPNPKFLAAQRWKEFYGDLPLFKQLAYSSNFGKVFQTIDITYKGGKQSIKTSKKFFTTLATIGVASTGWAMVVSNKKSFQQKVDTLDNKLNNVVDCVKNIDQEIDSSTGCIAKALGKQIPAINKVKENLGERTADDNQQPFALKRARQIEFTRLATILLNIQAKNPKELNQYLSAITLIITATTPEERIAKLKELDKQNHNFASELESEINDIDSALSMNENIQNILNTKPQKKTEPK